MKELQISGLTETAVERADYPPERVKSILKDETVAVVGYGVQGRGQSLNMRDNGVKVIVGQRKGGKAYDLCLEDGWVPGETLFDPEEAAAKVTVIQYLLSDAGQKQMWPKLKPLLTEGQGALLQPRLLASSTRTRRAWSPRRTSTSSSGRPEGFGHDRPPAVPRRPRHQQQFRHPPGRTPASARERCLALGVAIGSGYLFETTFQKEVFSDLTGERGVLMGAIYGLWLAQYEVLRAQRAQPERGVQRDGRRGHAEPVPAHRREGYGLDVRELLARPRNAARSTGSRSSATRASRCSSRCTSR